MNAVTRALCILGTCNAARLMHLLSLTASFGLGSAGAGRSCASSQRGKPRLGSGCFLLSGEKWVVGASERGTMERTYLEHGCNDLVQRSLSFHRAWRTLVVVAREKLMCCL
jgi:hypothetical protein